MKTLDQPLLVLAEDDDDIRTALAQIFAWDGFHVASVADGELLVNILDRYDRAGRRPDVIITDHRMPGYSGLDVLEGVRAAGWDVPVIVITAFGGEIAPLARAMGAFAVLHKPLDADDLRTAVLCSLNWTDRSLGKRTRRATASVE